MGRTKEYRNSAEKQRAYRERKKQAEQVNSKEREIVEALRNHATKKDRGRLFISARKDTGFFSIMYQGQCYEKIAGLVASNWGNETHHIRISESVFLLILPSLKIRREFVGHLTEYEWRISP